MRRGDVVTVAISGDCGKPRPAIVVQTNALSSGHDSVVVCMTTSHDMPSVDFRLTLSPTPENGLRLKSHVMVDKPVTVSKGRVGGTIGKLEPDDMRQINSMLTFVLGLSD